MSANSNGTAGPRKPKREKPDKPYDGFPMFAHPSGQWAKKIKGELKYFGVWADPEKALAKLNREWPYLSQGQTPPDPDKFGDVTLKIVCNKFLDAKQAKLEADDLSPRTFRDYFNTCESLVNHFGKNAKVDGLGPQEFAGYRAKLVKRFKSVVSLRNEINRVCIVFNFAHAHQLIEKPVSYGQSFDRPSAKALRKRKNALGAKLFERDEIITLLDSADVQLRAMILLGINCGFGNTDVSTLPIAAVDLKNGWVDFPRPKTEIPRRIPLWAETTEALQAALAVRHKHPEPEAIECVFVTRTGRRWVRIQPKQKQKGEKDKERHEVVTIDSVTTQFKKLLRQHSINGRFGLGFYTLRHTFETIGGESKDQVAVDAIMGHVDPSMAGVYRQKISDDRLRAVVGVVRDWLFPAEGESSPEQEKGGAE